MTVHFLMRLCQPVLAYGLIALTSLAIAADPPPEAAVQTASSSDFSQTLVLNTGDAIPVSLKPGESILIEMVSNPSTGYRWDATQLTREYRCYQLKEIETESSRTPTEGKLLAGAPVKQRWTLRHAPDFPCQAEQRVTWTYRRSWEPFNHADQQASVLLQGIVVDK